METVAKANTVWLDVSCKYLWLGMDSNKVGVKAKEWDKTAGKVNTLLYHVYDVVFPHAWIFFPSYVINHLEASFFGTFGFRDARLVCLWSRWVCCLYVNKKRWPADASQVICTVHSPTNNSTLFDDTPLAIQPLLRELDFQGHILLKTHSGTLKHVYRFPSSLIHGTNSKFYRQAGSSCPKWEEWMTSRKSKTNSI